MIADSVRSDHQNIDFSADPPLLADLGIVRRAFFSGSFRGVFGFSERFPSVFRVFSERFSGVSGSFSSVFKKSQIAEKTLTRQNIFKIIKKTLKPNKKIPHRVLDPYKHPLKFSLKKSHPILEKKHFCWRKTKKH